MASPMLSATQRYAAGALLALALRQAQIHQIFPLGSDVPEADPNARDRCSSASGTSSESDGDDPELWTHQSRGLLRPVFRFLNIDSKAWLGLEETAATSEVTHHIGAYMRIIFEEDGEISSEKHELELALKKGVDAMSMSLETSSGKVSWEEHQNQDQTDVDKPTLWTSHKSLEKTSETCPTLENRNLKVSLKVEDLQNQFDSQCSEGSIITDSPFYQTRRLVVLHELLSACVADIPQDDQKRSKFRKGYDARHRVAIRLLATWLDVKWITVEAMEIMVACSAMAAAKEEVQSQENESEKSKWSKWKRGGVIGAAALTGGALMALTGGLAAPAIAAGFGALAPTLGTLVPVIGASGFAAIATAAGSVAGSVAVAASFGGAPLTHPF
ncbi:transmembrane and coiled-coil domain-containing protein STS1-like [Curcuma longa]|uniref:transmembrane and coiled-coil domain-containing protein STS1-like n=1 Tax=Curcuma longa TaxID=136217 RepID=UPI003D9E4E0B